MKSYNELDVEITLARRLKKAADAAGITLRKTENTRDNAGLSAERVMARAIIKNRLQEASR